MCKRKGQYEETQIWQCSGTFWQGSYIQTVMFNNNCMCTSEFNIWWQWLVQFFLESQVTLQLLFPYSRKLIICCCFFLEAHWASLRETGGKILSVFHSTNQLPLWLLPALPHICPLTDCISGPLNPYTSMQLPGVSEHPCLGGFRHVTTSDENWAMPNNGITVRHFSGNRRNSSFNAARFYACHWIFPCSFFPFLSDKVWRRLGGTHPPCTWYQPWQPSRQRGCTFFLYSSHCSGGIPHNSCRAD